MSHRAVNAAVIIAAVASVFLMGIVLAAFFLLHRESKQVGASEAQAEFRELRARFSGRAPLLDMSRRSADTDGTIPRTSSRLRSFHTVIFDTRGTPRMIRIAVPYRYGLWFAGAQGFRWLGGLTFMDDTEFDSESIHLTADQIERHGPGLLVDHRHPSGGQFLSWVE